ncbi:MAG: right-handed parallel beta-helix repeat-containing protein [Phycisphaeraceae bacterium]|nr:right-handed parallel beta-helix repeat-containing protein [Phycisphaeraceae bacterium]
MTCHPVRLVRAVLCAGLLLVCLAAAPGRADIWNVMDSHFDPYARANIDPHDRAFDDARRFRIAYAHAARAGGGTIYVPAGVTLRFESIDPADTQGEAHVFIRHPAIRVMGDARGGGPAGPEYGSVITSVTSDLALFKVGFTPRDPLLNRAVSANGTTFENLHLTRDPEPAASDEAVTLAVTANGIVFDVVNQVEAFIYRTIISNCRIENHFNGVRSFRRSAKRAARATHLTIQACEISSNQADGMFLQDFGSVVVLGSFFQNNGRDGIRAFSYRPYWGGTMNITASGFAYNGEFGLRVRKYTTFDNGADWLPRDVHIAACQFDYNGAGAISARLAGNLNISASSITANTRSRRFPDQAAAEFTQCTQLTMTGVTFDGNNASALRLTEVTAATVSGCVFTWNNQNALGHTQGDHPALVIDGGRQISIGAVVFQGGRQGKQQRGVLIQGNPQGLYMTGMTFEEGMTEPLLIDPRTRLRNARIEYLGPAGEYRVFPDPLGASR